MAWLAADAWPQAGGGQKLSWFQLQPAVFFFMYQLQQMDAATINRPCYSEWEKLHFYHIATYGLNTMVCYSLKIKTNARGVSIRTYYRLFTLYATSLLWSSQLLWLEIRRKWHSGRANLVHGLATVCVPDINSCISWAATLTGKCRWVGPPQCTQWGSEVIVDSSHLHCYCGQSTGTNYCGSQSPVSRLSPGHPMPAPPVGSLAKKSITPPHPLFPLMSLCPL